MPMSAVRKHRFFWFVTIVTPFLLIVLLETSLQLGGYGYDLSFVREMEVGGEKYYSIRPDFARRYFLGSGMRPPRVYDDVFLKVKTPSTFRIFCLGESTMQGFPYEYNGALPRLLYDRLHLMYPIRDIEVINLGITAISSAPLVDIMKDVVEYEPDLIIIYTGHNEFYGAFGTASIQQPAFAEWFVPAYMRLTHLRSFQLLQSALTWIAGMFGSAAEPSPPESMMEFMAKEKAVPLSGELYARTKEVFRSRLEEIADITASRGVPVILSTTVSNIRDLPPFVSIEEPDLGPEAREQWNMLVDGGKKMCRIGDYRQAGESLLAAWMVDSSAASLAFEIGGCFLEGGDAATAKRFYSSARDLDALRFRASSEFNEILRSFCRERNLTLADMERAFEKASEHGIPGSTLLLEHVHPNIEGYFLMAAVYADLIASSGMLAAQERATPSLPDEIYKSLAMMTMFDFQVSFFRLDNLLHRWPFSEPDSTRHSATTEEGRLAQSYIAGNLTWEQAHYSLAESYIRQSRIPEAIREYLALAKVFWYDYQPLMYAGDNYLAIGSVDEARLMYERSRAREENPFILVRLGAASSGSSPDSAAMLYRAALELEQKGPKHMSDAQRSEVLCQLADALLRGGKPGEAEKAIDRVLQNSPQHKGALVLRDRMRNMGKAQ